MTKLTMGAVRTARSMEGEFEGDDKPVKGDKHRFFERGAVSDVRKTSKARWATSKAREGAAKATEPLRTSHW